MKRTDDVPATHAFIKDTTVPVIMARTAMLEMALALLGAMAPSAPITVPIEAMLANPHSAYVAMTIERS